MSSKLRFVIAGLTAAALIGGVMAANPAEAGKKKKHSKHSKVVQISKGGNAKAGNGGNGGKGGSSGNVNNTGNVGGGGGFVEQAVPGSDLRACAQAALVHFVGLSPNDGANSAAFINALVPECFPMVSDFAGMQGCLTSSAASGDGLTQDELTACINQFIPAGAPVMILVAAPAGSGSVFSGNGGNGAGGGNGGEATGGAGGNNTNSSTVTVNRDDHSIEAG